MTFLQSLFDGHWPEAVLFDLDGTLVDSAPDIALAVDAMLEGMGRPPAGLEKVCRWVGNGAMVLIRRALVDDVRGHAEEVFSAEEVSRAERLFFEAYDKVNGEHSRLFPGVSAFTTRLQELGIPQAIVTNKPARFVPPLLSRLGIDPLFKLIVAGDTLAVKKPAPEPVLHACESLGAAVGRSLMVGDSRNDVEAALQAGTRVACVDYGYSQGVSLMDYPLDWYGSNLTALLG